ncbi:MAG: 2-amino-4-hydroxy-6-hydroxymethyldihydropteridine diphosphokinase [Candidatus Marinimicrobia bacterium]|nr:2-amino-4-hydroxy-6-hydroxymethyldihydropteridine diphosphokinase [Candidatus Neomarinimicrobiota bacterium]
MMRIFLGLGSNMGERYKNLCAACELIDALPKTNMVNSSPIYETPPLYNDEQPSFLNMVVEISTSFSPHELLLEIKGIESSMGRDAENGHNLPRILDIDILAYGSKEIIQDNLTIPHLRIFERKFVLQPWSDIAEDFILVGMNKSIKSLLQNTPDESSIKLTQFTVQKVA